MIIFQIVHVLKTQFIVKYLDIGRLNFADNAI